jgi:enterochelin esterase-like enzyme
VATWRKHYLLGFVALLACAGCAQLGGAAATPAPAAVALPTALPRPTALPSPTSISTAVPTATPTTIPTITPSPAPTAIPAATACGEQRGKIERQQLRSRSMGRSEAFRIYTPACYSQQAGRRYPVVYLLHGGEHNEEHWDDVGVDDAADALIAAGHIPPLLIVLPDGGQDFGPLRGSPPPFAGYLHDELIPHIDASYRTLADRADRAIGGISYGAAWALLLAARYPASFSAVGAHSPAIGTFNGIYPDAQALCAQQPRVYVDVGDRDALRRPAAAMHAALDQAGCPNEFHVSAGSHAESYWNRHLEDYLRFYTHTW